MSVIHLFLAVLIFFFAVRFSGFMKLKSFPFYSKLDEKSKYVMGPIRKNSAFHKFISYIVNSIVQNYSTHHLITFLVISSAITKIILCFTIYIILYVSGYLFFFVLAIILGLLIVLVYCLIWEINAFCFWQSVLASYEFDFFEFLYYQNNRPVYKKIEIEIFDYTKFHQTKNIFQLKNENKNLYKNKEKYESLISRLTLFPISYHKTLHICNVFVKANLIINIFFLIVLIFIL